MSRLPWPRTWHAVLMHAVESAQDDHGFDVGHDAHELVALREGLASVTEWVDARLRELDGRATAGAPSLWVKR